MEQQAKTRKSARLAHRPSLAPDLGMITVALVLSFSITPVRLDHQNGERLGQVDQGAFLKQEVATCYTAGCNDTAAVIIQNMDTSVDPCENFYQYACGRHVGKSVYTRSIEMIKERTMNLIAADIQPNEPKIFKIVKKFYKSCVKPSAAEARGPEPLLAHIKKLGGWPVLDGDAWNETAFDWQNTSIKILDTGYPSAYLITVAAKFNPIPVFEVDVGSVGLRKHSTNYKYYNRMVKIATNLVAEKNRNMTELRDSVNFEFELREIQNSEDSDGLSCVEASMSVETLLKNYSFIRWQEFFRSVLPPQITVNLNDSVHLKKPCYYVRLNNLLLRTSKRIQANYLMSRLAADYRVFISTETTHRNEDTSVPIENNEADEQTRMLCFQVVQKTFPVPVETMYVTKYINPKTVRAFTQLIQDIKAVMKTNVITAREMSEAMRRRAIEKIDSMQINIGRVNNTENINVLEAIYKNFEMYEDKFYENALIALKLARFFDSCHIYTLVYNVTCVMFDRYHTFYRPSSNIVVLHIFELQDIHYSTDRPRYLNYGAAGMLIGHEIAHGITNALKYADINKIPSEEPEVIDESLLNYAQCMTDQYSNYTFRNSRKKINGTQTLKENISDNAGMQAAYRVYSAWASINEKEPTLPGINMTAKKLFWISMAMGWCRTSGDDQLINAPWTDPHSPTEFRINGPLTNMPDFANDFSCPVGSKMNPEKKCLVW